MTRQEFKYAARFVYPGLWAVIARRDGVEFTAGYAKTRAEARQIIREWRNK
jgi:hypothetical protein